MDDALRIIQHLYGEEVDDPTFDRRVAEEESLRREYERLRATKDALDRRSPRTPDPDVVDHIVDRAAEAAQPDGATEPAPDRGARAPSRTRTQRLQRVSAALAFALLVGLGWWALPQDAGFLGTATSESTDPATESATASPEEVQEAQALPEWDDRDEVVRLHRRIEHLQTQSRSDAWSGDPQTVGQTQP